VSGSQDDEFARRARIAAEAQDMAREYSQRMAFSAKVVLGLGLAGALLIGLLWSLFRPSSDQPGEPTPTIILLR